KLAGQVARGELTLIKLRDKIEGRPTRAAPDQMDVEGEVPAPDAADEMADEAEAAWTGVRREAVAIDDDSLVNAKQQLSEAVESLMAVLQAREVIREIGAVDRANLAKYLTIAK